jgi:hypothetical protein
MSNFGLTSQRNGASRGGWGLKLAGLALGLTLIGTARAQDAPQQDQTQAQPDKPQAQSPAQQTPPTQQVKPKPKYAPQDADKPPYASDYPSPAPGIAAHPPSPDQYDPDQDVGPDGQPAPAQGAPSPDAPQPNGPQNGPSPNGRPHYGPRQNQYGQRGQYEQRGPVQPPPATLTIPAGTVISVRVNEYLSSDKNAVGDRVTATLQQPIVAGGYVVARRGQMLTGQVEAAQKAGRVKGTSQLGIELTDLTLVNGEQVPILTELWQASGGTTHGADAATIGGTTALGAAIGAAADWGRGAAIGAGAGAAAGIGAVLLTRGRPTVVPPETPLNFRLVGPVKVDTTQGQQAFLPVSQQDYDGRGGRRYRAQGDDPGQPPYGPNPDNCGYYDSCIAYPGYVYPGYAYAYPGYYYPGFVGFYGGYGWGYGPRFYGGYGRGFGGHGFRR